VPFEIPEDIPALDDAALTQALEAALSEAGEFRDIPDEDLTEDQFNRLVALADFATNARATQSERSTAAAARAEAASAARAVLAEPVDAEVVEEEPAPAAAAPVEVVEEKVSVAASAKRVPVVARAAIKAPAPVDVVPAKPTAVLTASADVPGFSTGGQLADLDVVGKAAVARMRGLPTSRLGGEKGAQMRYSVAQIDLGATRTDGLVQGGGEDQTMVAAASREARLPGGSLTAAGGWCAPSETLYDLCTLESTEGLLDLPSVTVNRGGLRFTKGPSFSDIYNADGLGWNLTEAQVIAGTPEKTCLEIECPPFTEVRLDAVGLCITAPLLTQAAYPELVRRWIEGALIAHQHVVDAAILAKIVAGSAPLAVVGTFGNTVDALGQLELAAMYQRQQWRASFNETLEVLAPYWYKAIIRADLSRRTGVDLISVDDAQIERYFTQRNLRVQWLYNYLPLTNTAGVAVPATIDVVMYPAGTWVKGSTDVISLDAVYDSTNLRLNQYTALFVEEGVLVANTCFDSVRVTLNTCADGRTGAATVEDCLFAVATP
jgi:hypothetical protein